MTKYIVSIDQGTTSCRALVFDKTGRTLGVGQKEFEQHYPKPGWVEHDAQEIYETQVDCIKEAVKTAGIKGDEIAAVGITNQRETTVVWNRKTGKLLTNALVWQDTRVGDYVRELAESGGQDRFRSKTGLPLTTYFSGLKIRWILEHIEAPGPLPKPVIFFSETLIRSSSGTSRVLAKVVHTSPMLPTPAEPS